jgi:hypothetical protein
MNRLTNSVSGCVLIWFYPPESAAESFSRIKLPELLQASSKGTIWHALASQKELVGNLRRLTFVRDSGVCRGDQLPSHAAHLIEIIPDLRAGIERRLRISGVQRDAPLPFTVRKCDPAILSLANQIFELHSS